MTLEDKQFLKTIEHNKDFHDALIKNFPEEIPQDIKDAVKKGYLDFYDAGAVADDLYGCTEYPN